MKIYILEFFFRVLNALNRRFLLFKEGLLDETDIEIVLNSEKFKKFNFKLPEGYVLREFNEEDFFGFHMLMLKVNMGYCPLSYWKNFILPGGFLVVEQIRTKKVIGAAFAAVHPNSGNGQVGTLEWLAADSKFFGLGIGPIVAATLSERLIEEGFVKIRLGTQKHRASVIKMYQKLGWELKEVIT
jgi:ribosomal protein S18 acetylase RimI-like enzyme